MPQLSYLMLGVIAGIVSGGLGLGGGVIMVPALIYILGLSQHQAQGTALAVMLPPVFFLAVWRYYQEGHVNVSLAVFVAIGLTLGAFLGAHFVQAVPGPILKRTFGIFLVIVGIKMVLFK